LERLRSLLFKLKTAMGHLWQRMQWQALEGRILGQSSCTLPVMLCSLLNLARPLTTQQTTETYQWETPLW
jgi:hypothetical protein